MNQWSVVVTILIVFRTFDLNLLCWALRLLLTENLLAPPYITIRVQNRLIFGISNELVRC